jgi:hypothetical protein
VILTIGAQVNCSDGVCGLLRRLIVDPQARSLTDLVVEPEHRSGLARRVPVALLAKTPAAGGGGEVFLNCDLAAYEQLERIEELVS